MATGDYIQRPTQQLDPLPFPDDSGKKQAEVQGMEKMQIAQRQPPGAGYAGRGGQMAYLANNILTGWMAGRNMKAQKQLDKAKGDVTSSRSVYDQLADLYRNNVSAGKSKDSDEMKKLAGDINAAWSNYVNTADKYTAPDETNGKKKKNKAQKFFGMDIDPELFRSGSVNLLRKSGAPVLHEEESVQSQAARAQLGAAQLEIKDREQKIKDDNEWRDLALVPPEKRTKDQQERLDALERVRFPKNTEQEARDSIVKKVMAGQPIPPSQRELGEQLGILRHNQPTLLQHRDDKGEDWVIVADESGKEISRRSLGKGYILPDQAAIAKSIMQNQMDAFVAEYKRSFGGPGVDPQKLDLEAHRFALASISGYKNFGATPAEAEQAQFIVSDAIKTVRGELAKQQRPILDNFVVAPTDDPNGLYYWRTSMVQPQGEDGYWWWKKPTYYGGIGQKELKGYEREMIDRLRVAIKKKHKNLTDEQIKALIPESMFKGQDDQKPASQSGGGAKMESLPQQPRPVGTVRMRAPNGYEDDIPQEDVPYYQSKGATVVDQSKGATGVK